MANLPEAWVPRDETTLQSNSPFPTAVTTSARRIALYLQRRLKTQPRLGLRGLTKSVPPASGNTLRLPKKQRCYPADGMVRGLLG